MTLISSAGGLYRRYNKAGHCPICSASNATCGGPTSHVPIDIPTQQETRMTGPLQTYRIKIAGRHVLFRLNQADAQRLGGTPIGTPEPDHSPGDQVAEKARQPANKAKTPPNKTQPSG